MISLLDLVIKEFGFERVVKDKKFSYTTKGYHLIHFVISGEGYFEINKRKYNLKKGSLFYIPPNCSANYYPDPENPWEYIRVGFSGLKSEYLLHQANIGHDKPVFTSSDAEYLKCFSELNRCYNDVNEYRDLNLISIFYKIFYFICLTNNKTNRATVKNKIMLVNGAKEYIANNYQFNIKVSDIAKDVAITPEYLSAVFSEIEGISTIQYLKKVRMDVAKSLLTDTNLKVKEVAQRVGYRSPLYFSNDFKKYFGTSPLDFVRSEGGDK